MVPEIPTEHMMLLDAKANFSCGKKENTAVFKDSVGLRPSDWRVFTEN